MTIIFNEQSLYEDIVRVWGKYGAHAEIYQELCKRAGLKLEDVVEEPVEFQIKRIYEEEKRNKIRTIKRVRSEVLDGLGLKQAKDLVDKYV